MCSCGESERLFSEVLVPGTNRAACYLKVNPLGLEVTLLSAVMLNFGELLGSGIFSVPGVVLGSVGSVGLSLSFWAISPMFALGMCLLFADAILHLLLIYFLHSCAAFLHRTCQLLPWTVWCRGRISRAGLPSPKILRSGYVCNYHCASLVHVFSELTSISAWLH